MTIAVAVNTEGKRAERQRFRVRSAWKAGAGDRGPAHRAFGGGDLLGDVPQGFGQARPAGHPPIERLNKEVERRADVVGIFPNEGAIVRLIAAVLREANDEWQLQHRYTQTQAMAELTPRTIDAEPTQIATAAE